MGFKVFYVIIEGLIKKTEIGINFDDYWSLRKYA